ncbi:MAG: hypothetical protein HON60_15690 [Gammaproteobacteria bacterium]|jgi:hypothetical protein|nr:hypothetical protein [Gammaproteobacteria bacterium]
MTNALKPEHMTPDERLNELAALLAVGLIRLQSRQSSLLSAVPRDSYLDLIPTQSGHVSVQTKTEKT